jgi:phosphoribosyl 1,2-cyclic phosphodiesterase
LLRTRPARSPRAAARRGEHFHLDHVIGISYLPLLREARTDLRIAVSGPGRCLYGASTSDILDRLLQTPLFGPKLDEMTDGVEELELGAANRLAGFDVDLRRQDLHAHPTAAIRVEDAVALCTDTAYDGGNAAFCAAVAVLLHEAWFASDATESTTHSAAGEAARIAAAADAGRLLLIHVHPLLGADEQLLGPARRHFARTHVGHDLLTASPDELRSAAMTP